MSYPEQNARIVRLNSDRTVLAELTGAEAGEKTEEIMAANPDGAREGDTVTIVSEPVRLLVTVLLVFVLPLSAFIAGYALSEHIPAGAAAAVPFCAAAYLYMRRAGGGAFLIATARMRKTEE